jgi:hypothetical protein
MKTVDKDDTTKKQIPEHREQEFQIKNISVSSVVEDFYEFTKK